MVHVYPFKTEQSMPKHRLKNNAKTCAILLALLLHICVIFGGVLLIDHSDRGKIERAPINALDLRPDYPVSTFIYRRDFLWFLGWSSVVTGLGIALKAVYAGCAVPTPISPAACSLAAVGAVVVVTAAFAAKRRLDLTRRRLHLANMKMLYMGWEDKSSDAEKDNKTMAFLHRKIEETFTDDHEYDPVAADRALEEVFGKDHKFEGFIDEHDKINHDLYTRYGGPVPYFSFKAHNGMKFYHANIEHEGRIFHRFAFGESNSNVKLRRTNGTPTKYKSPEDFKKGGLDAEDCSADQAGQAHLNTSDQEKMIKQIHCNDGDLAPAKEMAAQVYDKTTKETISSARVCPFNGQGQSRIFTDNSCPVAQPSKNCGDESS